MKFEKNFSTYDDNAIIQKEVAIKLSKLINKEFKCLEVKKALELGCGTGIFTREFLKYKKPNHLHLNDFFNTTSYLKDLNYSKFLEGDMTSLPYENYDLIVSSSSLQWIENIDDFFKKLSSTTNNLAFSIYIEGNLREIKSHFNMSLKYNSLDELYLILKKYFITINYHSEEKVLSFTSPLAVLKHLKKTGVGLPSEKASIKDIKSFSHSSLTYNIGYFICSK